ncbi:YraN family protein [Rubellicoccus peritrichatus]|uniref:UPF0102 protein RZN69_06565 n=1 Tax=Rubellicoccus peritrichatus TaxID=3080537 RepID=A0AAQ3LFE8_9BACT|nr:YraN family protein [Puniceicoccus sp. CR14]WOO42748.1 YraN family protein [Puniceicoccus sp. CR14]
MKQLVSLEAFAHDGEMPLSEFIRSILRTRLHPEKSDRAARGKLGEREAASALKKKGYRILARNWREGRDEIDLVCLVEKTMVFVEVRTRAEDALVGGYHSVTQRKKAALRRVCTAYLRGLRQKPAHIRFDIVEVRLCQGDKISLNHHENIPLFGKNYQP